jgi:hypothetical protein
MLKLIDEVALDEAMLSMGYKCRESKTEGTARYHDERVPTAEHVVFDICLGSILLSDVERQLEYHGISTDVFYAQLEAAGIWPGRGVG